MSGGREGVDDHAQAHAIARLLLLGFLANAMTPFQWCNSGFVRTNHRIRAMLKCFVMLSSRAESGGCRFHLTRSCEEDRL